MAALTCSYRPSELLSISTQLWLLSRGEHSSSLAQRVPAAPMFNMGGVSKLLTPALSPRCCWVYQVLIGQLHAPIVPPGSTSMGTWASGCVAALLLLLKPGPMMGPLLMLQRLR
jgi:hypothetical protein